MTSSSRTRNPVPEKLASGLLDTSVVIDLDLIDPDALPLTVGVTAITMAELAAGPTATQDSAERARRQDRLQRAEAAFEAIPFGSEAARAYGRVHAAVVAAGRQPRRRFADLLIAAVAVAEGLPLVTRNPDDFAGLEEILVVVPV
ncbi:MAG TPA: VapC toxin family PIN domain ribonuclease [Propionibacteriaceae bacterium]|nr:type II toxin-antitoxin system VapC family toxin [Micropruina sp.]HBX81451.1 VapC toxin family PIN domain ribonuclease [Propionibacteriaceae bacterium]HBY23435.1 VapC toxin family PIN domain ribonuclease [Propionibacteriaceae bacterium]